MKKIFNIFLVCLTSLVCLSGCSKENGFGPEADGTGTLSTKRLMLSVSADEKKKGAPASRAVSIADFTIEILKGGEVVKSYVYSEMPGVIELPVGDYVARARSGANKPAAWSEPYYTGQVEFSIRKDEITEAQTIECRLSNVRVTVIFTDELKDAMADDCKVNVLMGENAQLDFLKDETRSGYFAYVQGSNTLVATFSGTVDGVMETNSRIHTDVEPGSHYRITYSLHKPGPDPGAGGSVTPGLTVDCSVEVVDLNFNVDPGDDPRPGGGERPGEGDNPDDPKGEGPDVTIEAPLSFDAVNEVTPASNVVINVASETGITVFKVEIISETLTPELLAGVNLTDKLDLVNPGEYESAIAGLGLPVNVGGQKEVKFDISSFMSLLAIYGDNSHKFKLIVADASGSVTKVLQLHMNP